MSRHLVSWSLGNLMACKSPDKGRFVQGEDASLSVHPT
jgi:hypothetical protein